MNIKIGILFVVTFLTSLIITVILGYEGHDEIMSLGAGISSSLIWMLVAVVFREYFGLTVDSNHELINFDFLRKKKEECVPLGT